jgi:3-oxoacyl-[acyl-carrier-protein] synthase-3
MGHFHPENEISNSFLESLDIGTTDAWIIERVGIRSRRTVLPLDYLRRTHNASVQAGYEAALLDNAETGARAARLALQRAGLKPADIGMVVAGGCCSDRAIPPDACRIADILGMKAPAFDLNSACSSFGAQLHVLRALQELPDFVLVVNAENMTRVVDYRDRATAVLWGDGSAATIVSRRIPSRCRVVSTSLASAPSEWRAVTIPRFGHFEQSGSVVQRFAIRTTLDSLLPLLSDAEERRARTGGRLRFIGHQANLVMLEAAVRRAGLRDEQHWHNVERFGNTGAAGAPSVLSERWDELDAGDTVLMVVVGAGLNWASLRMDVEE